MCGCTDTTYCDRHKEKITWTSANPSYVLKADVYRTAMKYAREYGWCEEIKEALAELGISPPPLPRPHEFPIGTILGAKSPNTPVVWIFVKKGANAWDRTNLDRFNAQGERDADITSGVRMPTRDSFIEDFKYFVIYRPDGIYPE